MKEKMTSRRVGFATRVERERRVLGIVNGCGLYAAPLIGLTDVAIADWARRGQIADSSVPLRILCQLSRHCVPELGGMYADFANPNEDTARAFKEFLGELERELGVQDLRSKRSSRDGEDSQE